MFGCVYLKPAGCSFNSAFKNAGGATQQTWETRIWLPWSWRRCLRLLWGNWGVSSIPKFTKFDGEIRWRNSITSNRNLAFAPFGGNQLTPGPDSVPKIFFCRTLLSAIWSCFSSAWICFQNACEQKRSACQCDNLRSCSLICSPFHIAFHIAFHHHQCYMVDFWPVIWRQLGFPLTDGTWWTTKVWSVCRSKNMYIVSLDNQVEHLKSSIHRFMISSSRNLIR